MIIPMYHGRPMKMLKEYPNFILFQDVKTGVKVSYNYYELGIKETPQIKDNSLKQFKRMSQKVRKKYEYKEKKYETSKI